MEEEIDTLVNPPSTGDDDIKVAPASQLSVSRFSFQCLECSHLIYIQSLFLNFISNCYCYGQ